MQYYLVWVVWAGFAVDGLRLGIHGCHKTVWKQKTGVLAGSSKFDTCRS